MTLADLNALLASVDLTPVWATGVLFFAFRVLQWFVSAFGRAFRS